MAEDIKPVAPINQTPDETKAAAQEKEDKAKNPIDALRAEQAARAVPYPGSGDFQGQMRVVPPEHPDKSDEQLAEEKEEMNAAIDIHKKVSESEASPSVQEVARKV